jgi:hypothetical protein
VAADAFTLEKGKALEIPVTVSRKGGYAETIEIVAVDLPEGVTVEAVKSEPKGDSAKSVKLKLSTDKPFEATRFRIIGKAANDEMAARFDFAGSPRRAQNFWLVGIDGK